MTFEDAGQRIERESPHKGWYSRGYLPHIDQPGLIQAITFRLADSLPRAKRDELEARNEAPDAARARLHAALDRGLGSCVLWDARAASAGQPFVVAGDEVRLDLVYRIEGNAHHDEEARAAKVERNLEVALEERRQHAHRRHVHRAAERDARENLIDVLRRTLASADTGVTSMRC